MEELVNELTKLVQLKDTTEVGDIVLIAFKNRSQLVHAVVQDILRDTSKKDEWWHLTLHFLTVPSQRAVWTLRMPQFTGVETFEMGEEQLFMKALKLDRHPLRQDNQGLDEDTSAKVVSLSTIRKKRKL